MGQKPMKLVRVIALLILSCMLAVRVTATSHVAYNDPKRKYTTNKYDAPLVKKRHGVTSDVIPEWPLFARIIKTSSYVSFDPFYETAGDSFSEDGQAKDGIIHFWNNDTFKISDFLILSRLLNDGRVIETPDNGTTQITPTSYLATIANENLLFSADVKSFGTQIRYARSFWEDAFHVGIEVPIMRKVCELTRETDAFTPSVTAQLIPPNPFSAVYSNGLRGFFEDILTHKKMDHDLRDERFGIGAVTLSINAPIDVASVSSGRIGAHMVFPSPHPQNLQKMLPVDLGNEGATTFGVFVGFMWNVEHYFNPHLLCYFRYSPTTLLSRRVARTFTVAKSNTTRKVRIDDMLFFEAEENLSVNRAAPSTSHSSFNYTGNAAVSDPDSTIAQFGDEVRLVNLRRGPEIGIRFGNVFNRLLFREAQLDVFYDLWAKSEDKIGSSNFDTNYDRLQLEKNTFQASHMISAVYRYRFRDTVQAFAGASLTIGGRRNLKTMMIQGGFTSSF